MSGTIRIYNTLSGRKEELTEKEINFFVCGPTVYDHAHLGHAKTYVQFDFIVKYLRHRRRKVFYLQNITDIDDKIINRARENGKNWQDLARHFEQEYRKDMELLGVNAVDAYARATDYIAQIVKQVQGLLDKGFAYRLDDGIYFEIAKFSGYGQLSGREEVKESDAVSRIDEAKGKRSRGDFCLWKFRKEGEPFWEAPFGAGRPGWHIEDTAITEKFFGPQYDIHGGAVDLIFPHHEAERAQMEALSGKSPFVRFWMHTGFLNIDRQKMSKSLGNFLTIKEVLRSFNARTLRLFFVSAHYRSAIDFSEENLRHARNTLETLDEFVFKLQPDYDDRDSASEVEKFSAALYDALDDDFNTPRAFAALFDFVREQNRARRTSGRRVSEILRDLNEFWGIFDFDVADSDLGDENIRSLIAEREECRARRDFARADEIREELARKGIKIYDTPEGVKYRRSD